MTCASAIKTEPEHPHTSGHNTACSIRCNTKWRPNHRAPKLLVVLLRVAYFFCGRKRLLRFHLSAAHSGRNVFGAVPFVSQSVCPLCLRVFLLWVAIPKLFQADTRQDWRKRRQKPWRLNLYSVIPSGLIPSGLIPSGCSDDDEADDDDDHDDDDDDDDNYGDDTDLSCAHSHGNEVPPCKPPSTASKRGRDATKPPLTSLYTARRREAPLR